MKKAFAAILVLSTLLAACSQGPEVLPTLAPSLAPANVEDATAIPTDVPATSAPFERPTLPPTWTSAPVLTNTPRPSNTPPPSNTPDPNIPTVVLPTRPPSCDTFGPDLSQLSRTYAKDQDVTVYWIDIPEAAFYKIQLLDDQGREKFADLTGDASYTFTADHFDYGKVYGWQATPMNALGQQICRPIGAELVPEVFTSVD